jgi:predicted MFS family arabinose efflux permease
LGDIGVIAAPSLQLLLAARLIAGIGYLLTAIAAVVMLMRITTGRQRVLALALWATFVPVSFILPFLTAGLAASTGSWRSAFLGHAAAIAVLFIIGLLILPRRNDGVAVASRTSGLGQVLRTPGVYLLGLSFGADAFLQTGIIASFSPYLARHYGANPMTINRWNVGAMVANTIGALLVGRLLTWEVPAYLIGFIGIVLTGLPAYFFFAFAIGVGPSIAACWVFAFGSGLLVGMWALLPSVAPSPQSMGASSGLVTQITLLGVLLGAPFAFAAQAASTPVPMLAVLTAGLVLCLAAVPVWFRASGHVSSNVRPVAMAERR